VKLLRAFWKWSWLVSLPVAIVFLYWGENTIERFCTFGMRYNSAPLPYHLYDTGEKEFYSLLRRVKLAVSNPWEKRNNEIGGLKVFNLFVSESKLAELNYNLPHSGYEYVEGEILNGDILQRIKFRYRGDFVYHWGYRKKSLRVKTSKKKLLDGIRTFNLIAPKQLETHFGCLLAKEMGLIAPRTDLVEVTLNGELLGTHVYVEQLEELTIRDMRYIPGDLYAGELFAKDSYKGITSNVFNYPNLWKKISINNHYNEHSRKPLERLLTLVNNPGSEQVHKELIELIDVQAWGRMAAFETLTQSFHYDNLHNWRLYFDPMKSRFYPVIWDPLGWNPNWVPRKNSTAQLDVMPSLLHEFLFKNAAVLRARAHTLDDFFKNGKDKEFLDKIALIIPDFKKAMRRDPLITEPLDVLLTEADSFSDNVKKVFSGVRQGYVENRKPLKYVVGTNSSPDFLMSFSVSGRVPLSKLRLAFRNTLDGPITGLICYSANGEKIEKDISGAISISGSTVVIEKTLISNHTQVLMGKRSLEQRRLRVEPGYYELTLNGLNSSNRLIDVLVDYGDGEMALAERVPVLEKSSFSDLYNIVESQPVEVPLVWKGVVNIFDVTEIHTPLIIEPGTVIRFSPGAGLILSGRLSAEGNPEQPILFVPLNDGQEPWGTLTLKGSKANGSRLKYCEFSGGSGLKEDLFEYTAMFSIHDVKDVDVENCVFRDSKITDDMVHAVYSEINFNSCLFERSLMDALDIDISDAVIERCHFIDSGNDAIDLMTSSVVVIDTTIENGGDKAISVGEGSHLLAINDLFRNNVIGVQAKDGSVAALYNVDLIGNDHALDAYKKNWRYNNGGDIYLYKSRVFDNDKMITADKKSKIRVYDSYIDKPYETQKGKIKYADTADRDDMEKAKDRTPVRNKREIELMKDIDSHYWELVDPSRRGALLSAGQ
jgi:hypothetical protein